MGDASYMTSDDDGPNHGAEFVRQFHSDDASLPPHVLRSFDKFAAYLRGKRIVLLLDYDGTLTPIVSDPKEAVMSSDTRRLLEDLSTRFSVGIVSGRGMNTIRAFVQITPFTGPPPNLQPSFSYVASHGYQIDTGAASVRHLEGTRSLEQELRLAGEDLEAKLITRTQEDESPIPGVEIEDNEFAISVHYRNVDPEFIPVVEAAVDAVVSQRPSLKKCWGKKHFDLRPALKWNKGAAVLWLLQHIHADPRDQDVVVIYMGDDLTDEDAFEVVSKCASGFGIKVVAPPRAGHPGAEEEEEEGRGAGVLPTGQRLSTFASLRVDNTDEVRLLLSLLLQADLGGSSDPAEAGELLRQHGSRGAEEDTGACVRDGGREGCSCLH